MSETERIQYKFMIPAPLKEALEEAAHHSRRSLSAEIIARLTESFDPKPTIQFDDEALRPFAKVLAKAIAESLISEPGKRPRITQDAFDELNSNIDRLAKKKEQPPD